MSPLPSRRWVIVLAAVLLGVGLSPVPVAGHEDDTKSAEQSAPPVLGEVSGGGGAFAMRNMELLAHMPVNTLGGDAATFANDIWGWTDAATGREYALVGLSHGTAFVDVTQPATPHYLGLLPSHTGSSIWRGIKVYADRAYVISDRNGPHGMQVFDLTQLRGVTSPTVFGEIPGAHYGGVTIAHNVAVNEATGFAYLTGTNRSAGGLHILDIRQPIPTLAGEFAADGYTHDVQVVDYRGPDAAFAGREIAFASNEDTLTVVDVTNKTAPSLVSRTGYSDHGYAHQGWLTEDQRYFLMNDEWDGFPGLGGTIQHPRTHLWDVSNLAAPVYLGFHSGETVANDHNLFIRGDFAFQANYASGLRVLDLRQLATTGTLSEFAFLDTFPENDDPTYDGAWGVYPFFASGAIITSDRQHGLFISRLAVPEPSTATLAALALVLLPLFRRKRLPTPFPPTSFPPDSPPCSSPTR